MILSQMSGFGWSEERERYKTHVLEHRDILLKVLYESQATGKGAVSRTSSDTAIPIDPRLLDDSAPLLASITSRCQAPTQGGLGPCDDRIHYLVGYI
jgi:hypothetical protein